MNFNQYVSNYNLSVLRGKFNKSAIDFYNEAMRTGVLDRLLDAQEPGYTLILMEEYWYRIKRPFFNVWPLIIDGLIHTHLDIPNSLFKNTISEFPVSVISIQLPIGHEIKVRENEVVTSIMVGAADLLYQFNSDNVVENVVLDFDMARADAICICLDTNLHNRLLINFRMSEDRTIEESLKSIGSGRFKEVVPDFSLPAIRLAIGLLLIASNEELVKSVVLTSDQSKFKETDDPKYVKRALDRGLRGWNVGQQVEMSPHFRRPHFGIRYTGKNGQVPKLVPIRGCIVKKTKIGDIPTGYLDEVKQ